MPDKSKTSNKFKNYFLLTTSIVATLVLFIQNIDFLFNKTKKLGHSIEHDLIIVDSYFTGDTLDIRLINNGDKTIALREAIFHVDSIWQVHKLGDVASFKVMPSSKYDVRLPDSIESYSVSHKIFQALSPNDVDRFQMVLKGSECLIKATEEDKIMLKAMNPDWNGDFYRQECFYFILFRLEIMLNEGDKKIQFAPMIHALGLTPDSISYGVDNCRSLYYSKESDPNGIYLSKFKSNTGIAIKIAQMPYYKSNYTKELMEKILLNH
jgi:hypothetical protein